MKYVGVGLRFVAIIIDCIVFFILGYIIALFTGQTTGAGFNLQGAPFFLWSLLNLAYYIVLEVKMGGTLGKLAIGLKVAKEDGSPLDWKAAIIRNILRIVDSIPFVVPYLLGAIFVWTSDKKQRLGDKAAGTVVVKK